MTDKEVMAALDKNETILLRVPSRFKPADGSKMLYVPVVVHSRKWGFGSWFYLIQPVEGFGQWQVKCGALAAPSEVPAKACQ